MTACDAYFGVNTPNAQPYEETLTRPTDDLVGDHHGGPYVSGQTLCPRLTSLEPGVIIYLHREDLGPSSLVCSHKECHQSTGG